MADDWRSRLAGARMRVDRQFEDRLSASEFSNQEWGLVMTAVEFEVRDPADSERAQLVARTDRLPDILPEVERAGSGGRPGAVVPPQEAVRSDSVLDRLRSALSGLLGSDDGEAADPDSDPERLAAAEALVEEYADQLQRHLEREGRWESVREAAAESAGTSGSESTEPTDPDR